MSEVEKAAQQVEWERKLSETELQQMLQQARRPGVFLRKTPRVDGPGLAGSWIGGQPTLPASIGWPEYESSCFPKVPMNFVAQISLSELQECYEFPYLPSHGTLFFFLELAFAPIEYLPKGSAQIIFVEEDVSSCPPRKTPERPDLSGYEDSINQEIPETDYKKWPITFHSFETVETLQFPNRQYCETARDFDEAVFAEIRKMTRADRKKSGHDGWLKSFFSRHFLFGDSSRSEKGYISLLTLWNDHDIEFGYPGSIPIAFQIPELNIQCFDFSDVNFSLRD